MTDLFHMQSSHILEQSMVVINCYPGLSSRDIHIHVHLSTALNTASYEDGGFLYRPDCFVSTGLDI
jgi:hypothetical protein